MRQLMICLLVALAITACTKVASIPPPVKGPAVLADDGVEIYDWEYFGPDMDQTLPLPDLSSPEAKQVGNGIHDTWLVQKDDGFALVWIQFLCATQPVVVVHVDASIEFWPGEIVGQDCEAMGVRHLLTVQWRTSIPFEQWKFTLHPPPEP